MAMKKNDKESRKPGMVAFSHDLPACVIQEFNELSELLPGKKREVLEACIEALKALPYDIKTRLMSRSMDVKSEVITYLSRLQYHAQGAELTATQNHGHTETDDPAAAQARDWEARIKKLEAIRKGFDEQPPSEPQ
jgi:ABC-type Zn uptake system ZnuABC Zn-binding protein ZnuA